MIPFLANLSIIATVVGILSLASFLSLFHEDHEWHYVLFCHSTYFLRGVFLPGVHLSLLLYDLPLTLFFEDSKGRVERLNHQKMVYQILKKMNSPSLSSG